MKLFYLSVMKARGLILIAFLAAAASVLLASAAQVGAQDYPQRIPFVIATGPTGGTYFPIGEAMAGIVSHPPGVSRCDTANVCGPAGLIASARSSDGAIQNVLDVNAHRVDSALAQSDVVADAVAGKGAFAKNPQTHIRVIAGLFPEQVHLVVRVGAHIAGVAELRGKRVSIGANGSGTIVPARDVLAAYGLPESRLKISHDPADVAAGELDKGDLDAFFFVGGAPVALVEELLQQKKAILIPIDGAARAKLLAAHHELSPSVIPAGTYSGFGALQTVSVRAVWIVNDAVPVPIVYGVTQALFNPANRDTLYGAHSSAKAISINTAAENPPAPLHPGAAQFYRAAGKLTAPKKGR
jgi:TRAP transporter TAXI family solute receptor